MKDRFNNDIKPGMLIKHIHHPQTAIVFIKNGELYAGQMKVSDYHESVIEIVDSNGWNEPA